MFTYNLATDVGKVRLLIPDTNSGQYVFEDDELSAFVSLEGSVKRGTALSLETIASNEVMTLKVMRLLDIQTDGARVSDALLARAKLLRTQAAEEDLASTDTPGFDIAEWVIDDFSARERIWKQALRDE